MLQTNSTTGTKGTIEMSTLEFPTFLKYIYQHFLHPVLAFVFFEVKAELFFSENLDKQHSKHNNIANTHTSLKGQGCVSTWCSSQLTLETNQQATI